MVGMAIPGGALVLQPDPNCDKWSNNTPWVVLVCNHPSADLLAEPFVFFADVWIAEPVNGSRCGGRTATREACGWCARSEEHGAPPVRRPDASLCEQPGASRLVCWPTCDREKGSFVAALAHCGAQASPLVKHTLNPPDEKKPDIPSLGLVWNTQYCENWIPAIPLLITWVFIVCDNLELAGSGWLDFWWCLNWFELVLIRNFPRGLDSGEVHSSCLRLWILRVPTSPSKNVNYFLCQRNEFVYPFVTMETCCWNWVTDETKAYLPSLGFVWKAQYCWELDPHNSCAF